MPAASCTLANILTQGEPGDPAFPVKVNGFSRAAVSARSFQVGAEFADINGASLGQQFGGSVANVTTAYTAATTATLTPPAGAVMLRYLGQGLATGAAAAAPRFDDTS